MGICIYNIEVMYLEDCHGSSGLLIAQRCFMIPGRAAYRLDGYGLCLRTAAACMYPDILNGLNIYSWTWKTLMYSTTCSSIPSPDSTTNRKIGGHCPRIGETKPRISDTINSCEESREDNLVQDRWPVGRRPRMPTQPIKYSMA